MDIIFTIVLLYLLQHLTPEETVEAADAVISSTSSVTDNNGKRSSNKNLLN